MTTFMSKSESSFRIRGTDVLRKRVIKSTDAFSQENKQLVESPHNALNKYITLADVKNVFAQVGMQCHVHDLGLYQQAFVHTSYLVSTLNAQEDMDEDEDTNESEGSDEETPSSEVLQESTADQIMPLQQNSGERLEYLGDSVCGVSVADYLYHRYPDEDEGFMTRLRTRLVCGSRLGEFAEKLGLQEFAVISRYVEQVNNGRKNYKILEDIFEAFIGAMFEDNAVHRSADPHCHDAALKRDSFAVCNEFIHRVLESFIDFADLIANDTNHKDQLLRYYQQHFEGRFPVYKQISCDVNQNVKTYTMAVLSPDGKQVVGVGTSKRKRASEQEASLRALRYYGVPI